jgi:hypothetical protein
MEWRNIMLTQRSDLVVQTKDGQPVAAVEIKNRPNMSRDIATEMHRNMIAHGLLQQVPYFLLVSQEKGFLWKGADAKSTRAQPDYEFPMDKVIARHWNDGPPPRLTDTALELLIRSWLLGLAVGDEEAKNEPEQTLAKSGFLDAIKDTIVTAEALR